MTFREKVSLVKDFFRFNLRVMGPQMMKMGWWHFKSGLKLMVAGFTIPIRGLFHTRELIRVTQEELKRRDAFIAEMNRLAQEGAKALEQGADPNAN